MKNKKQKIYFKIFTIVLLIVLSQRAILLPVQFSSTTIVNAVGIDKLQTGYEVSMQVITPKFETGVIKNMIYYSSKDSTISKCFQNLSVNLGKNLEFAHLNAIVLSNNIIESENLNNVMNVFTNSKTQNQNALIVATPLLASTILQVEKVENTIYDIANFLNKSGRFSTLKQILKKDSNTPLLLPLVEVAENNTVNNEETQENNIFTEKELKYNGAMFFINGNEKKQVLSKEDWENLSLLNTEKNIFLSLEGLNEEILVTNTNAKIKALVYNNIPRLNAKITVNIKKPNENINNEFLKLQVKLKIQEKLRKGFLKLKQNTLDVFSFWKLFYAYENEDWKLILSEEQENYFSKLELFANIKVNIKS